MVAFSTIFAGLLLSASGLASPLGTNTIEPDGRKFGNILCHIPIVQNFLCPRASNNKLLTVSTPIGTAQGVSTIQGVRRFPVKYASAARWAESSVVTSWSLPNGASNPSAQPLFCPQADAEPSEYSEDCLSMIIHAPDRIINKGPSNAPVMVWIHGGSFLSGSATGPGLDASQLAEATGSVVAVIQYRLGALGFMSPSGSTNLAVRDVMNSLKFLQKVAASFGGNANKITVVGQSSGAHMIRALLAAPSASSLFQSAILQSDPMDFGFMSQAGQRELQTFFNEQISCASSNSNCLQGLTVEAILSAQDDLFWEASYLVPLAGQFEPIRPVRDGSLINTSLDSTTPFAKVSKPILISTVNKEAAPTIYGNFDFEITTDGFPSYGQVVGATFGDPRTSQIIDSQYYQVAENEDARAAIERMGTDYLWKCSGWTMARNWVKSGGTAYVGLYTLGSTYPANAGVSVCSEAGNVCHQDDIQIVFGTAPNPTTAQSNLIKEVQARYAAFLNTGNPNASGLPVWTKATTADVHALLLGGSGEAPVGACDPAFWGSAVQYDYQYYA